MTMARPKVLFAITVYNGGDAVLSCLESAAGMIADGIALDILALDDASPEPGFSERVAASCDRLGIGYYRSPRNLGIPRNVNLGLLRAVHAGYDYVVIANSDTIFPSSLSSRLVSVAETDEKIGSVTAWSNNVSIYSIPNDDPDKFLSSQDAVEWVAESLYGEFGLAAMDVPVGISFCILIPTSVIRAVGLMDPIFGRGYCEETDWTLRSLRLGYRAVLAPACFVYHRGQGSTAEAGVLPAGHTTDLSNERIIDHRYPLFRSQVDAFVGSDLLRMLSESGCSRIVHDAGREWGYRVDLGFMMPELDEDGPTVTIYAEEGPLMALARFNGFVHRIPVTGDLPGDVATFFGSPPQVVRVIDPRADHDELAKLFVQMGTVVADEPGYPTRV